ncbi:glycosyltransferase family 39 protein [Fulvivirgaceae bacterium BMA10]|uniref:Glycosyltransferase family 39 protein n=1 Tax=Splendidivirga corallicola TaxID=3051826 RepID=A0ABT8KP34_9BACT|nr:glycosyltransferase family 39 protein [Fulvivirgaceae bacterium BMA10]
MAVLLLFLSFIFIFSLFLFKSSKFPSFDIPDLSSKLIRTALIWALILFVIVEGLNLFKEVSWWGLLISWTIVGAVLLIYLLRSKQKTFKFSDIKWPLLTKFEKFSLISVGVILLILLVIALVAPPNNYDSMTYHMARVAHWMQNESVDHYATHNVRQHYQPPFAEFIILNFQILSGSHGFANFPQWFSLFLCVVGTSLISRELGANRKVQIATGVFAATIPMPILQATSAKNDLVLAFFLVAATYYLLKVSKKNSYENIVFFSISIALSILTKGTAYLFAAPLLIWFFIIQLQNCRVYFLRSLIALSIVGSSIVIMNLGHYNRNYKAYDNILGRNSKQRNQYSNEVHSIKAFSSNVVRNVVIHLKTPIYDWNKAFVKAARFVHSDVLNFKINDKRTTFGNNTVFIPKISYHEDTAANLLQLILIITAIVLFFKRFKVRHDQRLFYQMLSVILSFSLFCFYLKWQPWHSRLHIPIFILSAPFCMIVLLKNNRQYVYNSLVVLMILAALPWVLRNSSRKIFPVTRSVFAKSESELLFGNNGKFYPPTIEVTDLINQYKFNSVGLYISQDGYDYPYWFLIEDGFKNNVRIEHIKVRNKSANLLEENFIPECIISTHNFGPVLNFKGRYVKKNEATRVNLYVLQSLIDGGKITME